MRVGGLLCSAADIFWQAAQPETINKFGMPPSEGHSRWAARCLKRDGSGNCERGKPRVRSVQRQSGHGIVLRITERRTAPVELRPQIRFASNSS